MGVEMIMTATDDLISQFSVRPLLIDCIWEMQPQDPQFVAC